MWREKLGQWKSRKSEVGSLKSEFLFFAWFLANGFGLLIGCQAVQVPKDPYELVTRLSGEPDVLNPVTNTSSYEVTVVDRIYESLLKLDNQSLKFKPHLASRWEISPDHLRYTFHLRRDVSWQDGKAFTADDVLYTYEKIQDPKVDAAVLRNYYRDVIKAEKLDPYTVRFTYREPYFRALTMLGSLTVIPKHLFENGEDFNNHSLNRGPVGTGPYRLREWKTGRFIRLERNEAYWGEKPDIRSLYYKILPDSVSAFQSLKKGKLDLLDLTAIQWERQTETPAFRRQYIKHRYFSPSAGYSFIGFNLKKPLFESRAVREAISHAVDRKKIVEKLLFNQAKVTTGPAYSLSPSYDVSLPIPQYDLELTKKILDEAGWFDHNGDGIRDKGGADLRFSFLYTAGSSFAEKLANILREDLAKCGIKMEPTRTEWVTFTRQLQQGDFDMVILAWTALLEEDHYQVFHSSQAKGGSNFVSFSSPEADRLMERARREFDPEARAKMNREIHRILYREQPYIFLFEAPSLVARHKRFQNVTVYPIGLDILEWKVSEIW